MWVGILLAGAITGLPAPVRGDFDHDGKIDVAEIVPAANGRFDLVIRRGAAGHPVSVIASYNASQLANLYVTTAKPGHWRTWCGKGGGADSDPCPRASVTLKGDTLDFGMKEASESVAIWTGQRFEVVLLSD